MDEWFPASGFRSAPTPDFERYDARFDPATKSGVIEIWIPIVPA
jgi:AraC family transcriptional regulator